MTDLKERTARMWRAYTAEPSQYALDAWVAARMAEAMAGQVDIEHTLRLIDWAKGRERGRQEFARRKPRKEPRS